MSTASPSSTQASTTIPYRSGSEVSGGEVAGILLATVLLLTAAIAVAVLARRLGWLSRWGVTPSARLVAPGLRVERALRISPRTVVFKLTDGQDSFLVAESRDGLQMLAMPRASAATEHADAA